MHIISAYSGEPDNLYVHAQDFHALQRENAALRKDAERLDLLDAMLLANDVRRFGADIQLRGAPDFIEIAHGTWSFNEAGREVSSKQTTGANIREALDAIATLPPAGGTT
jgi:hypothetical protein